MAKYQNFPRFTILYDVLAYNNVNKIDGKELLQ
jgi:hypothetical protein